MDSISCRVLLVHNSVKKSVITHHILSSLDPASKIKYINNSAADYIFSLPTGSIGFNIYTNFNTSDVLQNLLASQSSCKRSYAIFQGISNEKWQHAQRGIPSGKLHLLRSCSNEETIEMILRLISSLSDEKRTREQLEFFKKERAALLHLSVVRSTSAANLLR